MIRDHIITYSPYIFIVGTVLFLLFKVYLIFSRQLTSEFKYLMANSFRIHNAQMLRNTFNEKHKRFFKRSNNINKVYLVFAAIVAIVYGIFSATV